MNDAPSMGTLSTREFRRRRVAESSINSLWMVDNGWLSFVGHLGDHKLRKLTLPEG